MDWWLQLLQGPPEGPLPGLLARCITGLHARHLDILSAIATPPDPGGLAAYLTTKQETTGRITGEHALSGRLADYPLYALFTPAAATDRIPAFDVLRALLLAVLYSALGADLRPGPPGLAPSHLRTLSSLARRLGAQGSAAETFYRGLPADGDVGELLHRWTQAFRTATPYPGCPKAHPPAVRALLELYGERLGRAAQRRRRLQRERAQPRILGLTRRLSRGGAAAADPVLLTDGVVERRADAEPERANALCKKVVRLKQGDLCPSSCCRQRIRGYRAPQSVLHSRGAGSWIGRSTYADRRHRRMSGCMRLASGKEVTLRGPRRTLLATAPESHRSRRRLL